jgi:hypothetical protein
VWNKDFAVAAFSPFRALTEHVGGLRLKGFSPRSGLAFSAALQNISEPCYRQFADSVSNLARAVRRRLLRSTRYDVLWEASWGLLNTWLLNCLCL